MAKIQARAAAMQMVYEQWAGGDGGDETLNDLIGFTQDTAGDAESYQEDHALIDGIVQGVAAHTDELDQVIAGYLRGWTIDRIARVDLCVLRVAVYCLKYETSTAPEVIIREAVDMASRFSTEKSSGFVNGILSSYMKDFGKETGADADGATA